MRFVRVPVADTVSRLSIAVTVRSPGQFWWAAWRVQPSVSYYDVRDVRSEVGTRSEKIVENPRPGVWWIAIRGGVDTISVDMTVTQTSGAHSPESPPRKGVCSMFYGLFDEKRFLRPCKASNTMCVA